MEFPGFTPAGATAALWQWRRIVAESYAAVRAAADGGQGWRAWRATRDALFRDHPQSPLEAADRARFAGLDYFDYDPGLRFGVRLAPADGPAITAPAGEDGPTRLQPFARTLGLADRLGGELTLYWITGYGGGVFLPFADATSGAASYGGGRYLLDTIKGADLGTVAGQDALLDFNFAYNPSCCYADRYVCPLSPPANRLPAAILGGERSFVRSAVD